MAKPVAVCGLRDIFADVLDDLKDQSRLRAEYNRSKVAGTACRYIFDAVGRDKLVAWMSVALPDLNASGSVSIKATVSIFPSETLSTLFKKVRIMINNIQSCSLAAV